MGATYAAQTESHVKLQISAAGVLRGKADVLTASAVLSVVLRLVDAVIARKEPSHVEWKGTAALPGRGA